MILVAHGSSRSGDSAEPVLALARELERRGFPEVRTSFWKEETFLHQALDAARSRRLAVLPVFLAEGYFSRVVVPRELGLPYGDSDLGVRSVRLLPPLGADPALDRLVVDRARAAAGSAAPDPHDDPPVVVVLGHGTPRDPGSADAVLAVCARVAAHGAFARVLPAFIDQEPRLDQALEQAFDGAPAGALGGAKGRTVVVVPFLIASGFHGGETVPRELAAARGQADPDGPTILYAEPIGTHPALADVVERLLLAAGMTRSGIQAPGEVPLAALEPALEDLLAGEHAATVLQVEIRRHDGNVYALRHVADANRDADGATLRHLPSTEALVALARCDASGAHRPLRTACDLAAGWRHEARGIRALVEALVALYGPALVHWLLEARGRLRVHGFAEVAARQTGIYAELSTLAPAAVAEGVRRVCDGSCLRSRRWGVAGAPADGSPPPARTAGAGAQGARLVVPCPTPCPVLLGALAGSGSDSDHP